MGTQSCEDCHPGLVPRLLGCVQPGEDVTIGCALLSLVASVAATLVMIATPVLAYGVWSRRFKTVGGVKIE
jgi:hypothetical protein